MKIKKQDFWHTGCNSGIGKQGGRWIDEREGFREGLSAMSCLREIHLLWGTKPVLEKWPMHMLGAFF